MKNSSNLKLIAVIFSCILSSNAYAMNNTAPRIWPKQKISQDQDIISNILYLPISDQSVKNIPIQDSNEPLVDLIIVNNPRIQPLSTFNAKYNNTYEG